MNRGLHGDRTMQALPARTFRRATAGDIGLAVKEDASEEDRRSGAACLVYVDRYLADFCPETRCVACGAALGGMFGSFEWGICHGEGQCSNCGYPARGYHTIPDAEHKPILNHAPIILQYHPEALRDREGCRLPLGSLSETFRPRGEAW